MSTSQPRVQAGVSTGGQWAPTQHAEADISLDAGRPCRKCGALTKRSSGLCRRCDPARAEKRERSARRVAYRDGASPSVKVDEVRQCAYQFVPLYRGGVDTGDYRQCANAVVAPATLCHRHGGDRSASLGRSFAKAKAEAERGECFPLSSEWWDQTDARMEAAEGQLLSILSTDYDRLAQALVAAREQARRDSVARMSLGNQMLILTQHYSAAKSSGLSEQRAWEAAVGLVSEPHMTAAAWARHGRKPSDGASGVAAIWYKPYTPKQDEAENDDVPGLARDDQPKKPDNRTRWAIGAVIEYPLSATEGDDYEVANDPIGTYKPKGYGDAEAAIDTMQRVARNMGVEVEYVERKPVEGYAYWQASANKIVVWSGVADGDRMAVAHSLAHELGHARLGHGTEDAKDLNRPDKEAAAESFAALVCAHHGIGTSELSAMYVSDWRRSKDVKAPRTSSVFRSALQAYDEYVTEIGGEA